MKLHYKNKKIEELVTDFVSLKKKYNEQVSDKVIQRLSEIDAANHIMDLPPAARAHPHDPKSKEIFSIDILKHKHPTRLLIKPYGEYDIGDYKTIKEVEIQEIIKIHS